MTSPSFFWYDYETFGTDPRCDRICQFAGIRTDFDFNIIDQPVNLYCKASNDVLPDPEACLITGITPQLTVEVGLVEAQFMACIEKQFSRPETCVAGFNSIRFDDEFTRYGLYRNFFDPYAREWTNGCSRWDIIDLVRMARALRPDGIQWPLDDNGVASNRLELITRANNISHETAHDALTDVYATIAVAKLIKHKQPKLYDFVLKNKQKQNISNMLNLYQPKPVLHTSGMYPSTRCNTSVVYPLAQHPTNKNGIIAFDLRFSPKDLADLSAQQIIQRLYTPTDALPEGVGRIPLKTIHINKCPVLAPLNTLDDAAAKRIDIHRADVSKHLDALTAIIDLPEKLKTVYNHNPFTDETDPDKSLYSGGFFSSQDRQSMNHLRELDAQGLAKINDHFQDERIMEMLFRYRARNYPDSLTPQEKKAWDRYRQEKFTAQGTPTTVNIQSFNRIIAQHRESDNITEEKNRILNALEQWRDFITTGLEC